MKKTLIVLSVCIIAFGAMCACGNEKDVIGSPNNSVAEKYSTTEAEYTVGKIEHSEVVATGDSEKQIAYYDKDGKGVKLEFYKNDKLIYYYTCSAVDAEGNCVQQKYYNAKNKYLGVFDNGFFFNADGEQITEDMMEMLLDELE